MGTYIPDLNALLLKYSESDRSKDRDRAKVILRIIFGEF